MNLTFLHNVFARQLAQLSSTNRKNEKQKAKVFATMLTLLLLSAGQVFAQVDVTASGGTASQSYTTLKLAFDAVNAGTHTGTIAMGISANTAETVSAVLNASGAGSASYTSIVISPTGGASRIISGAITAGSPLVDLNGADNITINGLNTGGNALSFSNTTASSTVGSSTIRFKSDATNNIIQKCTISGVSTGAVGTIITTGTILFADGTTTGNDGNQLLDNNIGDGASTPTMGISSVGTSTAISNDNIIVTGNNIYNTHITAAGGANAMNVANSSAWNISGNKFYQTASRAFSGAALQKAIFISNASGAGFTINNNIIGYSSSTQTGMTTYTGGGAGRFTGIEIGVGASSASEIQGNIINGINFTTTSGSSTLGSASFNGIVVSSGLVNVGTTSGNTIGSASGVGTTTSNLYIITPTGGGIIPIYVTSSANCIISNNTIGAINVSPATASVTITFYGIAIAGSGNHTLTKNAIGNSSASNISLGVLGSTTGVSTFRGISATSTGSLTIGSASNGNMIQNIVMNAVATNSFTGILSTGSATTLNISYDTIQGIVFGATSATHASTFTGISSTGTVTTSVIVTNNALGTPSTNLVNYNLTATAATGALLGINVTSATTATTHTIQNNDFRGIVYAFTGSGTHTYITLAGATAANNVATIDGNTFTNLNVNTTSGITFISNNYTVAATGTQTINNNSIVTAFNKGGAGGTITLSTSSSSSAVGATIAHTNNNFSNITVTGGTIIAGWLNTDGPTGSVGANKTITGNTFSNWVGGTSAITALSINFGGGSGGNGNYINNNTISNITGGADIIGIAVGSNVTTVSTISGNTVSGLSSTGASNIVVGISSATPTANIFGNSISGLSSSGATAPVVNGVSLLSGAVTTNIYKNKIHGLSVSAAVTNLGAVNGVLLGFGTTVKAYNNIIGNLTAPAANDTDAIRGISITSTATTSTYSIYNNTIMINATSAGASFGTTGIYHTASTTATTAALDMQNNIIVNTSTPVNLGKVVCFRRSSGAANMLANYGSNSNRNLFYAGTPSAANLIYYDIVSSAQTISAYKTGVFTAGTIVSRDAGSVSEMVNFISTTGTDATFLHINGAIGSQIESGGLSVATVTEDFDGTPRTGYPLGGQTNGGGLAPDIGADEFDGVLTDLTSPTIVYTPFKYNINTTNFTITNFATITDASEVKYNAGTAPRFYYKKSTDANTFTGTNTSADNAWKWVEATHVGNVSSFIIDYSILSGGSVAVTDTIQYFVVAQDSSSNINVSASPSIGFAGTSVSAISSAPTTPNSYVINTPFGTTINIGGTAAGPAGGNTYVSLSEAMADANVNSVVRSVYVTNGGSGYTDGTSVIAFAGGGGTGASASVIITGGAVTQIKIITGGSGYTSAPTLTIPTGTGAALTVNLSGGKSVSAATLFELTSTYVASTEDSLPIVIPAITNASATNTITIRPATGNTAAIVLASTSGILNLNGAKYVTIDGRAGGAGANALTIENTLATANAYTIQLINEANFNTIKYVNLKGAGTGATTSGVVMVGTTTGANGNDNNAFDNCNINNSGANKPINTFYAAGSTTTTAMYNNNNTISHCNISNFFHTSTASTGINIAAGNSDWTITGNKIFQTDSIGYTAGSMTVRAIGLVNDGNNFVINDNTIAGNSAAGTGLYIMGSSTSYTFSAIELTVGTGGATSVQNNTITNINMYNSSNASVSMLGMNILGGNVNIGTITGNIIGSTTINGAILYTAITAGGGMIGIRVGAGGIINIQNNQVSGIRVKGTTAAISSQFHGIAASGGTTVNILDNIVGSASLTNSINIEATTGTTAAAARGIIANGTTTVSTIANNLVANITNNYAATGSNNIATVGIIVTAGTTTITGNTVRNLTTATQSTNSATTAALVGIGVSATTAVTEISGNTIHSLGLTGASTSAAVKATGIAFAGSTLTNTISKNFIHSIYVTAANTGAIVTGIDVSAGTSNYYNNIVRLGINPSGVSEQTPYTIYGINETGGSLNNFYFNTLYVGGTNVGTTANNTFAFRCATVTTVRKHYNNIFYNVRSNATTGGKHYAANIAGTTTLATGLSLDYNNYFANGTGGFLALYNSADISTLGGLKMATGRDTSSLNTQVLFAAAQGDSLTCNLHINSGITQIGIESNGTLIAGITTDFDGNARTGYPLAGQVNGGGTAPDIGADEFDGTPSPNMVYASSTAMQQTGNIYKGITNQTILQMNIVTTGLNNELSATQFTLNSNGSTNIADITNAKIYYTGSLATFSTTTQFGANFTPTIANYTVAGTQPLAEGNNYFWLVYDVALNATSANVLDAEFVNVTTAATIYTPTTSAPAGTRPILGEMNGNYTIGASETFPNFTTITSAINDLNIRGVSAAVTFNLMDATYPSEIFPIIINEITGASATNKITIKPNTGVVATIDGSIGSNGIFKLNGADYITIDGSNSGGNTRNLTINNASTAVPIAGIAIVSLGTNLGAHHNTIKNCNISTAVVSGASYGVSIGGNTLATAGSDNDTISVINNNFTGVNMGVYAVGNAAVSATGMDSLYVVGNTITINSASTTTYGMKLGNGLNSLISRNTISVETSGAASPVGISVETGFVNATVLANNITKVFTTNTTGFGGRGITIGTATTSGNLTIANNLISGVNGSNFSAFGNSSSFGIGVGIIGNSTTLTTVAGGINIYNNSINMNGDYNRATACITAALFVGANASALDVRNNVFVNSLNNTHTPTGAGSKNYAIYSGVANTAFTNINNNNYYVSGTQGVIGFLGSARTTLADLQTATAGDAGSVNINPSFTSSSDLTSNSCNLNNKGVTIAGIISDYNGTLRNITTPDMGAIEYTPATISAPGVTSPVTYCQNTTAVALTATGTNTLLYYTASVGGSGVVSLIPSTLTANTTSYYVADSNAITGCISNRSQIDVIINPAIAGNTISAAQAICSGATPATLTGSTPTGGQGSPSYSWLSSTTNASAGFAIASGTSNTIDHSPGALSQTTWFKRVVSAGTCKNDTSATVKITVNFPLSGNTTGTSDHALCSGATPVTFAGSAVSGGDFVNYTYSWISSTTSATAGYAAAAGTNNATSYSSGALTQTTWFKRVVNSGVCSSDSTPALAVTITNPIANNTVNGSQSICAGSSQNTLTGSTATGGDGSNYTYKWISSTTDSVSGFGVASGTSSNANYNPAITQNTWFRRVVISGACANDTSYALTLFITQPITTNGMSNGTQTICSGSLPTAITGLAAAGGDGVNYIYKWLSSITSSTAGFTVASGTSNTQSYTPGVLTQTTWYKRVVSSGYCVADTTGAVAITVTNAVTNNTVSSAQTICSGATPNALTGTLPAGGDGSNYSYSWLSSTTNATSGFAVASGTNNASGYTPAALTQNTWYKRVVSSGVCVADTSSTIAITITNTVANNNGSATSPVCSGSSTIVTGSTPTGGDGMNYTYSWLSSSTGPSTGFTVASGTNNNKDYTTGTLFSNMWFKRVVTSGACAKDTSAAIAITVNPVGTWTGATSSAWGTTSNWSCPAIPTSGSSVTVLSSATNMPVITDARQVLNLNIQAGASLTLNNAASRLDIFGIIVNTGTFTNTNGKIVLAGSNTQTLPAGTYAKVELNNFAGANLGGTVTLADSLILTSGILSLGANNLTLGNASFALPGSASNYVSTNGTGKLTVNNIGTGGKTTTVIIPVGNSTYNPISLSNAGTADNFTVSVIDSVTNTFTSNTPTGSKLTSGTVNRTWIINEAIAGGSNATVTLGWPGTDELGGFVRGSSYVARHNGTAWVKGSASAAIGSNPYSQTLTGVTSFSPFGVGSGSTLPVKLLSFTAAKQNKNVNLKWTTASETNNNYFELQRSIDSKTFESIAKVKGNGTTNIVSNYSYLDEFVGSPLSAGNIYYRLIQVDFDNTQTTSNTVVVNMSRESAKLKIAVYPNPFTDVTTVNINALQNDEVTLTVTDIQGRVVLAKNVELLEGENQITIDEITSNGMYFVNIITETESLVERIVKAK
jgi:hypothetical protein